MKPSSLLLAALAAATLLTMAPQPAMAADAAAGSTFQVADIQVRGLNRIALGAALLAMPVKPGDLLTPELASQVMKRLFATGDFDEVTLGREGNVLIVSVKERPTIAEVEFTGNKQMDTDTLRPVIEQQGLKQGDPLSVRTLSTIKQSLEDFYHSAGMYQAQINPVITELPRNRVNVKLEFNEGVPAKIQQINIVGNQAFDEDKLIAQLELRDDVPWWNFAANQRYDAQKFRGDLETLRTYYMDRGYVRYRLEQTSLEMTPDRKGVYLTVVINEGKRYDFGKTTLSGEIDRFGAQMQELLEDIKEGEVYSQREVTDTEKILRDFLGKFGYAYCKVQAVPRYDDDNLRVDLDFTVELGERTYVGQILITGNATTDDTVIRRELRQMDGTWLSSEAKEISERRLNRTGYFEQVNVELQPSGITNDVVSMNVNVKEQPTGAISGGVGFGSDSGFLVQASVSQNNVFGWGTRGVIAAYQNSYRRHIELGYTDPYFTIDQISLGGRIYYDKYDGDDDDVVDYDSRTIGGDLTLGYLLSETWRVDYTLSLKYHKLRTGGTPFVQGYTFWHQYKEASDPWAERSGRFFNYSIGVALTRNTLDRSVFPTAGSRQVLSGTVTVPGSDVRYYRLTAETFHYFPLDRDHNYVFAFRGRAGYANGYGNKNGMKERMPFWENFYLGSSEWMRGFDHNSVGPHAVYYKNHSDTSVGGNAFWTTTVEFYTPTPFLSETYRNSVRTSIFMDCGSLWDTRKSDYRKVASWDGVDFDDDNSAGKYRASVGVSLTWISPMGPLSFSLAKAIKKRSGDDTESFNFNIGGTF